MLLVVDVQTGPVEEDALLARRLRRADVPVLVVVNKVDTDRDESDVPAFLTLGLGDPVPVSALHGRGSGDLLDQLVGRPRPTSETEEAEEPEEPRFAIVGRPERRQVEPVQPAGGGGALGRVRGGGHDPRQPSTRS